MLASGIVDCPVATEDKGRTGRAKKIKKRRRKGNGYFVDGPSQGTLVPGTWTVAPFPRTRRSIHDFTYKPPPADNCPRPHSSTAVARLVALFAAVGVAAAQFATTGEANKRIRSAPVPIGPGIRSFSRVQTTHNSLETRLPWNQRRDDGRERRSRNPAPFFAPLSPLPSRDPRCARGRREG